MMTWLYGTTQRDESKPLKENYEMIDIWFFLFFFLSKPFIICMDHIWKDDRLILKRMT